MKKHLWLFVPGIFAYNFLSAQNVGIGTTSPHPNAQLEIKGTNKGLLIPRGDAATRAALNSNTAKGLIIYDTVTNTIWVHNGNGLSSGWNNVSNGTNFWVQQGTLGTEIKNSNSGGFWSANDTIVNTNPGVQPVPVSGAGTRLMWIPSKAAFRAGTVDSTEWNADSIGTWSFATGYGNVAKGLRSFAAGGYNTASASYSSATGEDNTASGIGSTASGVLNIASGSTSFVGGNIDTASGNQSFAMGFANLASGTRSVAMGSNNKAIASSSVAMGSNNQATGPSSFAIGNFTQAPGNASFSTGGFTNAGGTFSQAHGVQTNSRSYGSVALGRYNDSVIASTSISWQNQDPLLYVGNGTSDANRHNAMVIYKNGNMVLKNPTAVLFAAPGSSVPVSSAGTRMMWLPERSAFRVGTVIGTNWDTDSIGTWSFASGYDTKAKGDYATAMGAATNASGRSSTAIGNSNIASGQSAIAIGQIAMASGDNSTAIGNSVFASGQYSNAFGFNLSASGQYSTNIGLSGFSQGNYSTSIGLNTGTYGDNSMALGDHSFTNGISSLSAGFLNNTYGDYSTALGYKNVSNGKYSLAIGDSTIASGVMSTAMGAYTLANSFSSFVTGRYNASIAAASTATWVDTDPLFIIGNGIAEGNRSNAMMVLKNGNTAIGSSFPGSNKLNVSGNTQTDSLQIGSGTKYSKMQSGTLALGTSAAQLKLVTITFPVGFAITPKINVTPRNEAGTNNNDVYAVTVRSISTTFAVINVFRVDAAAGWGQNLQLDWTAWTQ